MLELHRLSGPLRPGRPERRQRRLRRHAAALRPEKLPAGVPQRDDELRVLRAVERARHVRREHRRLQPLVKPGKTSRRAHAGVDVRQPRPERLEMAGASSTAQASRAPPRQRHRARRQPSGLRLLPQTLCNGASLKNVDLSYAQLYGANFTYANLENVNLQGAFLTSNTTAVPPIDAPANLTGAHLKNVNLAVAQLAGAVFTTRAFTAPRSFVRRRRPAAPTSACAKRCRRPVPPAVARLQQAPT